VRYEFELSTTCYYFALQLELFLETWLSTGQKDSAKGQSYKWTIYRLGEPYMGKDLAVRNGFAAWVGWKVAI
jgi:hypothetical protein